MRIQPSLLAGLAAGLLFALTSTQAADAPALWKQHCAKCHGETGKAEGKMGQKLKLKDYSDAAVQAAMTDEEVFKATKDGVVVDGKEKMKGYADKLSDEEIHALVAHIRSFKAN